MSERYPKFSVVIPTKQRHETLKYTLKTCLEQDFDDYEIIVCDNFSSPETKEIVDLANSDKIKYIRSEKELAMHDNWELALSQVIGEYVIVLGDDDALMPYALKELDKITKNTDYKAIRWERIYYSWPCILIKEVANQTILNFKNGYEIIDSKKIIKNILSFRSDYTMLPMLYNSAVHKSLINELKTRTGRIFNAFVPDVYSGFAFAFLSKEYISLRSPLSINAGSSKSCGVNGLLNKNSDFTKDMVKLFVESGIKYETQVPPISNINTTNIDCFLKAKKFLKIDDTSLNYDKKLLIKKIIDTTLIETAEEKENIIKLIKQTYLEDKELLNWFEENIIDSIKSKSVGLQSWDFSWKKGWNGNNLMLDASEFDVYDVYEVSKLCDKLLGYSKNGIQFIEEKNYETCSVGNINQKTREEWLEKTLKSLPDGTKILDAGAGELAYKKFCTHLNYVSQDFGQYNGQGDGSALQMGAWEQSKLDIVSDITNIPEPDNSFDAIMCVEVLEHLPDPLLALKELTRLLKTGGKLVLTAPFCSATHFAPYHFSTGFNRYYYEKHLEELGYKILEIEYNGNFFEYLAQEIRRIPWVREKYTQEARRYTAEEYEAIKTVIGMLQRYSDNDNGSQEFFSFGLHILAEKKG